MMLRNICWVGLVLLSGCANPITSAKKLSDLSDIELAQDYMQAMNYRSAIHVLEEFRTEHPLSPQVSTVEKLLIECYAQTQDYPLLQAATDRFLYEHLDDPLRDYISYLRYCSILAHAKGYPYTWLPIERATRDITPVKEAFLAAKTFLTEYPQSPYAPNVAHTMPELKELIARHYYLKGEMLSSREEPIGAIRSYQYILSDLKDTSYAPLAQTALEKFSKQYRIVREIEYRS